MQLLDLFVCVCVCVCVCVQTYVSEKSTAYTFSMHSKVCKAENVLRGRGTTGRPFCEEIRD